MCMIKVILLHESFFLGCGLKCEISMLLFICLLKHPLSRGSWLWRRDVSELSSCPKMISLMVSEIPEWLDQNVQKKILNWDNLLHCLESTISEGGVQDWRKHWSFQHGNAYIPEIIHMVHWEHKEVCCL